MMMFSRTFMGYSLGLTIVQQTRGLFAPLMFMFMAFFWNDNGQFSFIAQDPQHENPNFRCPWDSG